MKSSSIRKQRPVRMKKQAFLHLQEISIESSK
jgi:hypothetical protein